MLKSIDGTFAFYHVPKTGGQSISTALLSLMVPNPDVDPRLVALSGPSRDYHWDGMHTPAPAGGGKRKRCAFVRNPWHRALSRWRIYRKTGESFMAFWRRPHGYNINITRPMLYYCNPSFEFIGRFENLAADFVRMCELVGIDPPELPHTNQLLASGPVLGPDWRSLYDDESRRWIAKRFAGDIDMFGYTFEE